MGTLPFLLAASITAAAVPHAASQFVPPTAPAADPALWVVNDDDTIIYLFGTFHALDGNGDWFQHAVRTAFSQSDQLMLETLVPKPPAIVAPSTGAGNLTPRETTARPITGTVAQLAPSASFLATTKVVMNAGRSTGLSTDRGADAVLREAADEIGKPVGGLESFQSQLNMFRSLPSAPQPAHQDQRTIGAVSGMLTSLESGWKRGEVEQTFAPLLMQMRSQSPEVYNAMFVQRNTRWAHWIADRLHTPGTIFVAVGAGHLSGPDSVQNQLAALGVKSARIN